jgi:hypothetical protein
VLDVAALLEREGVDAIQSLLTPVWSETQVGDLHLRFSHSRDTLANRLIHPAVAGQTSLSLLQAALSKAPEVLRSHAVPPKALAELVDEDLSEFFDDRGLFLSGYMPYFLASRARWEASDRGSLQSMIVSDEED